jgi:hypothetical protein
MRTYQLLTVTLSSSNGERGSCMHADTLPERTHHRAQESHEFGAAEVHFRTQARADVAAPGDGRDTRRRDLQPSELNR